YRMLRNVRQALLAKHAFLEKISQTPLRIVLLFQRVIARLVIEAPELVPREIRIGIERLDPAQLGDLAFDFAIEMPFLVQGSISHYVPETKIDVGNIGAYRIERESLLRPRYANGTQPDRQNADFAQ